MTQTSFLMHQDLGVNTTWVCVPATVMAKGKSFRTHLLSLTWKIHLPVPATRETKIDQGNVAHGIAVTIRQWAKKVSGHIFGCYSYKS